MKKFVLFLFCAAAFTLNAQDFEGTISMELIYKELPQEMQAYKSMLPSEMIMQIKHDKSRVEKNMGMGSMIIIVDREKGESIMLMDMAGQKMYTRQSEEEASEYDEEDMEVNYLDGTKTIAGYKCKKGEMVGDEGTVVFWYTEEITSKAHQDFNSLKGFPLQYEIEDEDMTIVFKAKEVKKESLSDSIFEIPEGYRELSDGEMEQLMDGGF